MKRIALALVDLFAAVYPPNIHFRVESYANALYSIWISRAFCAMGKSPSIARPMHLRGGAHIVVGDRFIAGYRTRIEAWDKYLEFQYRPRIVIGNRVCFNYDCHVGAINYIEIGDDVLIGSRVLITDHGHGDFSPATLAVAPGLRPLYSRGPVIIGRNVWIGESVCILPNVTIGEGSIVAAGSVVTRSMPSNSLIAGVPARVVKQLTERS